MADPLEMLAKGMPSKPKPKPAEAASSSKVDAMRDLIAAVSSSDAEAAALAFERAYHACAEKASAEDEGDEYEE